MYEIHKTEVSYVIFPDTDFKNTPGECNNTECPNKTIYWNPAVKNKDTGRAMPLNEPFTGNSPPQPHRCMRNNPPKKFIRKYFNDPILDSIDYSGDLYRYLKSIGVAK